MKDELGKQSQKQEEEEDLSNKPRTKFSEDQLESKWKSYANKLKKKGRQGMFATMSKNNPIIIGEENLIRFDIDSELQRIELNKESTELLKYLRIELNNYGIKIDFNVLESIDDNKKHLSSKEKFIKMTEKNPDLKLFISKFNLDIEY